MKKYVLLIISVIVAATWLCACSSDDDDNDFDVFNPNAIQPIMKEGAVVDFFNSDYRNWENFANKLVYCGQIDEYFNYKLGKLNWRTVIMYMLSIAGRSWLISILERKNCQR